MTVKFDVSVLEAATIDAIVMRWQKISGQASNLLEVEMDITACHANGTPLRLPELLTASDGDFIHDISGIRRHIDRITGKLTQCFSPRFSKGVTAKP